MRARIRFNLLVRWLFPNREHTCWFSFCIRDVRMVLVDLIRSMSSRLPESKCLRISVLRSLMRGLLVIVCVGDVEVWGWFELMGCNWRLGMIY